MSAPLFPLGRLVATRGARDTGLTLAQFLGLVARHARGEWGHIDPEDFAINRIAVSEGDRILSAYPIDPAKPCAGYGENCLWIITEADRSVTTILLPDEY